MTLKQQCIACKKPLKVMRIGKNKCKQCKNVCLDYHSRQIIYDCTTNEEVTDPHNYHSKHLLCITYEKEVPFDYP